MRLNPAAKMCPGTTIEKKILREAFSDSLPKEIAWRQKEQFSDGVGYGWIDTLKKITSESVTDEEMANAAKRFPIIRPKTRKSIITAPSLKSISPAKARREAYLPFLG